MGGKCNKTNKNIAYLLDSFLTPSTTFVTDEIRYLYEINYSIRVYVLDQCKMSVVDPINSELLPLALFTRPIHIPQMVSAHIFSFFQHPINYIKTLYKVAKLTAWSWEQCIRSIVHFIEGVYIGRKMIDNNIDRVHVHFAARASTAAFTIWSVYGIPYSITTHAYDLFVTFSNSKRLIEKGYESKKRNLLILKLSYAQHIITISEFNYRLLTEKLGIKPKKIRIIRCGVNTTKFRRRNQIKNGVPVILSVGTLRGKKGHHTLIQACAYLKEQGYQFSCNIIGGGSLFENLRLLRDALHLEDCVHLCGPIHHSKILSFFEEADIFALACLEEEDGNMDGIPVALMEAMAMEIPIVTTNISGIPELIKSGESGFLVEPNNVKELSEKIAQLLQDHQLRQQMGRYGREKVLEEYNQEKNFPLVANVLVGEVE